MIRSMFTAISALTLHQSYMDVVADNLANANTAGYKSSRVTFQDQFAQMIQTGAAPSANLGGVNPIQIGLGTRMGNITPDFSQGALQSTGRSLDLAIQGDGFFVYANGAETFFSRDGTLSIDSEGNIGNSATGMRAQGWLAVMGAIDSTAPTGNIQIPVDASIARPTTQAILGGNLNSTVAIGDSTAVTMGVYDSLGVLHSATLTCTKTADNVWGWAATSGATGSGTLVFDTSGRWDSGSGTITVTGTGGAAAAVVTLDLEALTQLADTTSVAVASQDGLAAGNLTGYMVSTATGEIFGTYSNGLQERLGQIALAGFLNPAGLLRIGQSLYQAGLNSGEARIGVAGTGGRGTVVSGYLEGSNVDLAQEFTSMILAQRGFQASSRVITASDEMLRELVNLAR
jgi:flagellar hook protein FlgE